MSGPLPSCLEITIHGLSRHLRLDVPQTPQSQSAPYMNEVIIVPSRVNVLPYPDLRGWQQHRSLSELLPPLPNVK